MFRIAICDDEQHIYEEIRDMLVDCYIELNIEVQTPMYFATAQELLRAPFNYDLLFLDIRLDSGHDGVQIGRKLREMGNNAEIAIITSLADRALDAYRAEILAFIVKPITRDKIRDLLGIFLSRRDRLYEAAEKKICIRYEGITTMYPIKNVAAIVSRDHKRFIYTIGGQILQTMENWKAVLGGLYDDECFFWLNKTTLINLMHLNKCNKETGIEMTGGFRAEFNVRGRGKTYIELNERLNRFHLKNKSQYYL